MAQNLAGFAYRQASRHRMLNCSQSDLIGAAIPSNGEGPFFLTAIEEQHPTRKAHHIGTLV